MANIREVMVKKYGSEELYKQHMRDIRKNVRNHPGGSFRLDKDFAKNMSKKALQKRWGNT